jgi:hypothetical protein
LYYTYADTNKCTFVDSATFSILPAPELDLPSDLSITLSDTITFVMDRDDQYYIWPNDSTSKSIQLIGAMMANGENIFPLVIENVFGCKIDYDLKINASWPTEVLNNSNQDQIILFPNPVSNELNVILKQSNEVEENINILVHDLHAKNMPGLQIKSLRENEYIVDVKDLPAGIYLIAISSSKLSFYAKFVVNR